MSKAKMIGKRAGQGPGGRDCPCCGDAPGKARKAARRATKRAERRAWRADAVMTEHQHQSLLRSWEVI